MLGPRLGLLAAEETAAGASAEERQNPKENASCITSCWNSRDAQRSSDKRQMQVHSMREQERKLLPEKLDEQVSQDMLEGAKRHGLTAAQYNARVAGGTIISNLMNKHSGQFPLRASVYDACIVMPQIARSNGWPRSFTILAVTSFVFLFLNFFLQLFILYMIHQEEFVLDRFAGQMYLCDFGASVAACPEGPNCIGPGGTNYADAGRMYSFTDWANRRFLRDALAELFPHLADEVRNAVDPGEYGVENHGCRLVCVFIFMISVMSDLHDTAGMLSVIYHLPSAPGIWLEYDVPKWSDRKTVKEMLGCSELDFVKFKLDGMPLTWKIVSLVLVIIPKFYIWGITAKSGVCFLMETAGIENVIVNVTALTFVLNLDEMIFSMFGHKVVQHIMAKIQPIVLESGPEDQTTEEAYSRVEADRNNKKGNWVLFPFRLLFSCVWTVIFVCAYYHLHCQTSDRGGYVSVDMHLPATPIFPVMTFLLPWMVQEEQEEAYWTFKQAG